MNRARIAEISDETFLAMSGFTILMMVFAAFFYEPNIEASRLCLWFAVFGGVVAVGSLIASLAARGIETDDTGLS